MAPRAGQKRCIKHVCSGARRMYVQRGGRGAELEVAFTFWGAASSGEVMGHESQPRAVKYRRLAVGSVFKWACLLTLVGVARVPALMKTTTQQEQGRAVQAPFKGRVSLPTNPSTFSCSREQQSGAIMGWLLKQVNE